MAAADVFSLPSYREAIIAQGQLGHATMPRFTGNRREPRNG